MSSVAVSWLTACILLVGAEPQQKSFTLEDFGDFFTAPLSSPPASEFRSQPTPASQLLPQPAPASQFRSQPAPASQFRSQPAPALKFGSESSPARGTGGDDPGFSFPAALPYVHDPTGDAPIGKQNPSQRNRQQQQQLQPQQRPQHLQQQQPQQQANQFTLARNQWEAQVAKHKQIAQKHISKVNAIVNDQEKLYQRFLLSEEGADFRDSNTRSSSKIHAQRIQGNTLIKTKKDQEERSGSRERKLVHLSQFLSKMSSSAPSDITKSKSEDIPLEIVEDIEENVVLIEELARAINDLAVLADLVTLNEDSYHNKAKQSRRKGDIKFQHRDNTKYRNGYDRKPQELKERKNFIEKDKEVLKKHRNVNTKNINNELLKQKEAIVNEVNDYVIEGQRPKEMSSNRIRNTKLNIRGK